MAGDRQDCPICGTKYNARTFCGYGHVAENCRDVLATQLAKMVRLIETWQRDGDTEGWVAVRDAVAKYRTSRPEVVANAAPPLRPLADETTEGDGDG